MTNQTDSLSSLYAVPEICPRCKANRKYERTIAAQYGCWSWWHQYVTLDRPWPERLVVGGGVT